MPVAVSAAQRAWVKVPAQRRKPAPIEDQKAAIASGPLAYFACLPAQQKPSSSKALIVCPKYDIDAVPVHGKGNGKRRQARIASAPHGRGHGGGYDEEDYDGYDDEGGYYDGDHSRNRHSSSRHHRSSPHTPPPHSGERYASQPTRSHPRATSSGNQYWTGPSNRVKPGTGPRSWESKSTSSGSSSSSVSARWANATAPLDLR